MLRGSEQETVLDESRVGYSAPAGEIQPHGCLLCFTRNFEQLLLASTNSSDVLGADIQVTLGRSARYLRNEHVFDRISAGLAEVEADHSWVQEIHWARGGQLEPFWVTAWVVDERMVVEFEPSPPLRKPGILTQTNNWLSILAEANDENILFDRLAQGVFELTGHDRVLVLDMHEDGCATVVAESKADKFSSVLTQRIPEQQFPPQLRDIYAINPIRAVLDTRAEPVPLLASGHPLARVPLDLRRGNLRAVPSIHRVSMSRMGIRSGLHLAIHDGEGLRALVLCHSSAVTPVSPLMRDTCWTLAQMASQRLAFLEMRAHRLFERRASETRSLITEKQTTHVEQPEVIVATQGEQWLDLLDCSGVALLVDRQVTAVGDVPDADALWAVKRRLTAQHHEEVSWYTDHLDSSILAGIENLHRFGGVLALHLPTISPPGWLLFFRRVKSRTYRWVADPYESEEGVNLLALRSASERLPPWEETLHGWCDPWSNRVRHAADELAAILAVSLSAHRISGLVRQLRSQNEYFAGLARTDGLTQVANRYFTEEVLAQEEAAAKRYARPFSVILFDVDHFKSFNDAHGHAAGDEVLKALAASVAEAARDTDHFGRWGGEEFLVVVGNSSLDEACQMAERMRVMIASLKLDGLEPITVSLGVAEWTVNDDWAAVVARADEALYRAKTAGRNRIAC